jgi:hypothetical protein
MKEAGSPFRRGGARGGATQGRAQSPGLCAGWSQVRRRGAGLGGAAGDTWSGRTSVPSSPRSPIHATAGRSLSYCAPGTCQRLRPSTCALRPETKN